MSDEDAGLWVTPEELRAGWPDAPKDDGLARELLWAAQTQCATYAPALTTGADGVVVVPANYRRALRLQCRELLAADDRSTADAVGLGDYAIRVRPLGGVVRQLLRPPVALGPCG